MYSVTGEKMSVEGRTSIMLRSRTGFAFKRVELVVTRDTTNEIIIGLKDIKRTGLLPPNWPHELGTWDASVCKKVSQSQVECDHMRTQLIREYSDIFSDEISTDKVIGEPLHVQFKKGIEVRPRKHTCARRIPIHQEKAAREINLRI